MNKEEFWFFAIIFLLALIGGTLGAIIVNTVNWFV